MKKIVIHLLLGSTLFMITSCSNVESSATTESSELETIVETETDVENTDTSEAPMGGGNRGGSVDKSGDEELQVLISEEVEKFNSLIM
ncbi:MAG: hypothetical protein ACK5LV_04080 [Lachnospirales bacterium]